jgi:hypothetical protein
MEPDHRMVLGSGIEASRCFSARLGTRAPHPQLGHARSRITGSPVAVSDNNAHDRKGSLR